MQQVRDRYDFELLFTDNHSTDRSFKVLAGLARRDPRVRAIRFSRNFGFQRSIVTAYSNTREMRPSRSTATCRIPLRSFSTSFRNGRLGTWVYGVRTTRQEGWWMNATRKLFYRLIDSLSEEPLPLDAGDFRLVDRRVLDELLKVEDNQPYLRGTIAALGFEQIGIPYSRAERKHGKSKFSFGQLIGLALDGILNHSVVPLRIATYLGLLISSATFLGAMVYGIRRIVFGRSWPAGFATLVILILGSLSLNALFLGIIGEYLGRIYRQVKRRPLTIIERELNAPDASTESDPSIT